MFYRRLIFGSLFGLFLVSVAAARVQAAEPGAAVAEKPAALESLATETALDRYLAMKFPDYSRNAIQSAIARNSAGSPETV